MNFKLTGLESVKLLGTWTVALYSLKYHKMIGRLLYILCRPSVMRWGIA